MAMNVATAQTQIGLKPSKCISPQVLIISENHLSNTIHGTILDVEALCIDHTEHVEPLQSSRSNLPRPIFRSFSNFSADIGTSSPIFSTTFIDDIDLIYSPLYRPYLLQGCFCLGHQSHSSRSWLEILALPARQRPARGRRTRHMMLGKPRSRTLSKLTDPQMNQKSLHEFAALHHFRVVYEMCALGGL